MDGSIALVEFSKPSRRACVKTFEWAHIEVGLKIWFRHRLREKPRTLQAVTPEQLAKAATVDAQAAVAVDLKDHLHSETSSVMSMKQGDPVEVCVEINQ